MIVYQHKKADTGEVFYIGIGVNKYRAGQKSGRNKLWQRIYNKHGRTVEIICDDVDVKTAEQIEQYLIAYYGRITLNTGCLANITGGGGGTYGFTHSQDTKAKMSESAKKRNWDATRERIKKTRRKFTEEEVKQIRASYIYMHPEFGTRGLAKKYNVSQSAMHNIVTNINYQDVK